MYDRCPCGRKHYDEPPKVRKFCRFFWDNPIGFIALSLFGIFITNCIIAYKVW